MRTRRRTFIKASGMGAAGLLVSAFTEPRPAPPLRANGTARVRMTIWGSCLYEFRRLSGVYTLRVGFLSTGPEGCEKIEHTPELRLISAKKVGGTATVKNGTWIIPKGTLTIDPESVRTASPLDPVGVDDKRQPCPKDPGDPCQVRSLGFIPLLKTKGNFKLKDDWPEEAMLVAVFDRGTVTANPVLNDGTAMPVWHHRTEDTAEEEEYAFSDTTRYEVQLTGSTILFTCGNQTLEIGPDGEAGLIGLQLNAMPTDSAVGRPLDPGQPLPHFCALYAPFRPNGNPRGAPPDAKQRYVPRYLRYCSEELNKKGVRLSPGKYCSGGRIIIP